MRFELPARDGEGGSGLACGEAEEPKGRVEGKVSGELRRIEAPFLVLPLT